MTLPPKLEKLLENWPAKIISLVAAILVYAFYQISTLQTRYFIVPIEIKQDSGMVPTALSEDSVRIAVRGNISDINTLETKDFQAYADMGRYVNEGSVIAPIQLELSDNVRILKDIEIKLQPETIEVTLEKEVASYIPVKLDYAGGTAHGYEIESVKAVPSVIKVKGPRSIVHNMEELNTDILLFDDLYASASFETELLEINSKLICEHEGPIGVTVTVVPSKMKRNFTNLPVKLKNMPDSFIVEAEKVAVSCLISGNELEVEKYKPVDDLFYADCSQITEPGEYDIPVQVKKIYQLTIDSFDTETVHVTVTEIPEETVDEIEE